MAAKHTEMDDPEPFEKGDFHVSDYALGAAGNVGKVLLGVTKSTGSLVAVKKIMHTQACDIQNEIKVMEMFSGKRNNRNVVKLLHNFDYPNDDPNASYLIMEFCDMGHLEEYYIKYKPGPNTSVEIMKQISEAVSFLHDLKIMHRDLKPQNVMMTYGVRPFPKLVDFGLAIEYETEEDWTMYGPNSYAAPEIFLEQAYNESVDVFSIGMLCYAMINYQTKGSLSPNADEPEVPPLYHQLPIGKMMKLHFLDSNFQLYDCATVRPDDPEVVGLVKEVVSKLIQMKCRDRISVAVATDLLQEIFDRPEVSGALEVPPPKPLTVAVAEIVNRVVRGASSSS